MAGYIITSANSLPDYCKTENALGDCSKAIRKYGKYPLDPRLRRVGGEQITVRRKQRFINTSADGLDKCETMHARGHSKASEI